MTRLNQIIDLQRSSFAEKVNAVFTANPVNEEQAAQLLIDLVFAEQTHGTIGEAAFAVLDYDSAKDWLQTLFVTAISICAPEHGARGLAIEVNFFDAWIDSGRTRALSDMMAAKVEEEDDSCFGCSCSCSARAHQVSALFSADTTNAQVLDLYRLALSRHVLVMTEKHADLLVEKGIFASLFQS